MILDKICRDKVIELKDRKKELPLAVLKEKLKVCIDRKPSFEKVLREEGLSIIGEAKKASPSKGVIKADFDIKKVVEFYDKQDVQCLSILTEQNYFKGSIKYLEVARGLTNKPLLRKDFIVDEYQLYESKLYGADAVLLIVAVLGDKLSKFYKKAKELNLDVLVEVHNEEELNIAMKAKARVIGINNRNLKTFDVDIKNTEILKAKILGNEVLVVSESGISSDADIEYMKKLKVDAVLIGEYFMRGNYFEDKI